MVRRRMRSKGPPPPSPFLHQAQGECQDHHSQEEGIHLPVAANQDLAIVYRLHQDFLFDKHQAVHQEMEKTQEETKDQPHRVPIKTNVIKDARNHLGIQGDYGGKNVSIGPRLPPRRRVRLNRYGKYGL